MKKKSDDNSTNDSETTSENAFLADGNQTPKDNLEPLGSPLIGTEIMGSSPDQKEDFSLCSLTDLRKKFPRTYKCWDNMKQRRKKGAIIHKDLADFRVFLTHVGPCEDSNYTLDRLDNDDPEYAPGKVEWRDKYSQNSNRGNNVLLTHEDGRRLTIAQGAATTKQKASTLYKRRAGGWNDMEIITGIHESQNLSLTDNPWPYGKRDVWESLYRKAVLFGYGKPRLFFLREKVCKILSNADKRLWLLSVAVQANIGFDNEWDKYNTIEAIAENGLSLDEFNGKSVNDLNEIVNDVELKKSNFCKLLKEVTEQVEYELTKKKIFSQKHTDIKESDFLKYFEEAHPRPEYTVNLPPPKLSSNQLNAGE